MRVRRPVLLLVSLGVLLAAHASSVQATSAQTASSAGGRAEVIARSEPVAAAPRPAEAPTPGYGNDTRVSVKVLPVPTGTPTPRPTPTSTHTRTPTTPSPRVSGHGGGGLPKTGMNGKVLFTLVALGLGTLATGAALLWMAAFRRRRQA